MRLPLRSTVNVAELPIGKSATLVTSSSPSFTGDRSSRLYVVGFHAGLSGWPARRNVFNQHPVIEPKGFERIRLAGSLRPLHTYRSPYHAALTNNVVVYLHRGVRR